MSFDRSQIDELLTDIRQATAHARQTAREQAAERERFAAESREIDEQRAGAARRGEHGRDWQEVQARIDRGDTSLAAVLAGQDQTPAAQRIQDLTAENLVSITAEMAEHDEATAGERFSELNEAFAGLRATMERAVAAAQQVQPTDTPE